MNEQVVVLTSYVEPLRRRLLLILSIGRRTKYQKAIRSNCKTWVVLGGKLVEKKIR